MNDAFLEIWSEFISLQYWNLERAERAGLSVLKAVLAYWTRKQSKPDGPI